MTRPRLSGEAIADIEEIFRYGALRFGMDQTERYVSELLEVIDLLGEYPFMAAERDDVRPPIRLHPYRAHHIFYDAIGAEVVIQRGVDWRNGGL